MELVCAKYQQKVLEDEAYCQHPQDYCKFRSACFIQFMSKENRAKAASVSKRPLPSEVLVMDRLNFAKGDGLLPAIAQDHATGEVLMLAYINEEAWKQTLASGRAHYWSRSRNQLWLKGESSGHFQVVKEILVDCDQDTVIYRVEQLGGAACHKGYHSCFFRKVEGEAFTIKDKLVFNPAEVYTK
jgi:phosphoribosyl-AMP cyclohydrolase